MIILYHNIQIWTENVENPVRCLGVWQKSSYEGGLGTHWACLILQIFGQIQILEEVVIVGFLEEW